MEKHELTKWRRKHGLTLKKFAESVGVKESTVCNWEKGRFRPAPRYMQGIQDFVNEYDPDIKAILLFY